MRSIWIFLILLTSLLQIGISQADALQQAAGPIVVELKPGETKTVQWGLVSDKENDVTVVELKADGNGAEFLSFPKTVYIEPGQLIFVDITVTIPPENTNNVELNPTILATESDQSESSTLINIQMKKTLSIIISSQNKAKPELENGLVITEPTDKTKIESKSGGCLIATAAFGSELAPQVQYLRELRDNTVLGTQSGASFMTAFNSFYYSFSPTVADWERQNPVFKEAVKISITPLITTLSILQFVDIGSEEEMLGYGIGLILLNVGMYLLAPVFVIYVIAGKI